MSAADALKPEAVTRARAAAVGLAVAAATQTAALALACSAFVMARPFDRPAQGPTGSMLLCALAYLAASWLALALAAGRAFARPVPDAAGTPAVRLAVSSGTVAAVARFLTAAGFATGALFASGVAATAALSLAEPYESIRFLGLDGDLAAFLAAYVSVVWAAQAFATAVAAHRRTARRDSPAA